jgi:hypothetical protein
MKRRGGLVGLMRYEALMPPLISFLTVLGAGSHGKGNSKILVLVVMAFL